MHPFQQTCPWWHLSPLPAPDALSSQCLHTPLVISFHGTCRMALRNFLSLESPSRNSPSFQNHRISGCTLAAQNKHILIQQSKPFIMKEIQPSRSVLIWLPGSCSILLIIWGLWVQINWGDNLMTEREIISCKWYLLLELWKRSQGSLLFSLPSQLMAEKAPRGWHPQWQTTTAKSSLLYFLLLLPLTVTMLRDSVLPSPLTDEESKAQRGKMTCWAPHSLSVPELGFTAFKTHLLGLLWWSSG